MILNCCFFLCVYVKFSTYNLWNVMKITASHIKFPTNAHHYHRKHVTCNDSTLHYMETEKHFSRAICQTTLQPFTAECTLKRCSNTRASTWIFARETTLICVNMHFTNKSFVRVAHNPFSEKLHQRLDAQSSLKCRTCTQKP